MVLLSNGTAPATSLGIGPHQALGDTKSCYLSMKVIYLSTNRYILLVSCDLLHHFHILLLYFSKLVLNTNHFWLESELVWL